jgi:hypothetical protein
LTLQTEFEFNLPIGYVDSEGTVHRNGVMRLANAKDEIEPRKDPRVHSNEAYAVIILLSRVITKLGDVTHINPKLIEGLYSADFSYLQDLYLRINRNGNIRVGVVCPHCDGKFDVEVESLGGLQATP